MKRWLACAVAVSCLRMPLWAGLLTPQGAAVLDSGGQERSSFSNNEKITLKQVVHNGVASPNRIEFKFILTRGGAVVFTHAGNAVPGAIGNASSRLTLPISRCCTVPDKYTLSAEAFLDGVTVAQPPKEFMVSSPNIVPTYPPNGARKVAQKPVTFQWTGSGAFRYRVTVWGGEKGPSFENPIMSEMTAGGETSWSYPETSDPNKKLSADPQIYWWKVEGLDANGNVNAVSEPPYSFSIDLATQLRDLAVTELEVLGAAGLDGGIPFRVRVQNQGNSTESNVQLKFSVGALPAAGSPTLIALIEPGGTLEFDFTGSIPSDQTESMAVACVELFDDNVPNNCRTVKVTRATGDFRGDLQNTCLSMPPMQICEAILSLMAQCGDADAKESTCAGVEGTVEDLCDVLAAEQSCQAVIMPVPGAPIPEVPISPTPELEASGPPQPGAPAAEVSCLSMTPLQVCESIRERMEQCGEPDAKDSRCVGVEGSVEDLCAVLEAEQSCQALIMPAPGASIPQVPIPATPEPEPVAPPVTFAAETDCLNMTPMEACEAIRERMEQCGDPDAKDSRCVGVEGSAEALCAVLEAEQSCQAIIMSVPGGPPVPRVPIPATPEPEPFGPPGAPAVDVEEDTGQEWRGMAAPFARGDRTLVIDDNKEWRREWSRLSDEKVPKLRFKNVMVVGVMAGSLSRAKGIDIEEILTSLEGLTVRYRLVGKTKARAGEAARVPFHLKAIPKTGAQIRFERIEGREER
ncbi:MAG: hypothetical protein WC728_09120 [Elusimicrobiota bacterium]